MCGIIKFINFIGLVIEIEILVRIMINILIIILMIFVFCFNFLVILLFNFNIVNCFFINMVIKIVRSKNGKINIICCYFILVNELIN